MDLNEKVLKTMAEMARPVKAGEVAKELNLDSKEVSKAIKELKKEGKIASPKRCYYQPNN